MTPPNNIHSFTSKVSPTYTSRVVTPQSIKEETPQGSIQITHNNKVLDPVASIFDIDSSVTVGKIELGVKLNASGAVSIGRPKQEVKSKIIKRKLKHPPHIRSIEDIPNNLIKIEVKEDLSGNLITHPIVVSPLKCENTAPCVTSTPQVEKRPLPELNEFNFDTEVPKKRVKLDDTDISEQIIANELDKLSEAVDDNYLDVMGFDGVNNSMNNSGQVGLGFNDVFEDMIIGNCQNVTQEIDDDWLNSMLI